MSERNQDLKPAAREIFAHALAGCSIADAVKRTLRVEHASRSSQADRGPLLRIEGHPPVALDRLRRIRVVAMGKAAAPMLEAVLAQFAAGPALDVAGVLIAPQEPGKLPGGIRFFAGGHPLPNEASLAGARAALEMLSEIADFSEDEALALFLISGGASAMMELPLDGSIPLADTAEFYRALVHCGANIVEMNCVRKHFSAVKGGRLALAAGTARKLSLVVSDVPPAHLDALASGPTLPDTTTIAGCREILARYALLPRFPDSVRRFFESADLPETPKPGELNSPAITLLDSAALARAARVHAASCGFHTVVDDSCDDWPYDRAAEYLLNRLRALRREHHRCCVILTGEVSVPVPPFADSAAHLGGRNQHLALCLATQLRDDDAPIAILSAGSDGIDGNSAAAGAVIDARTLADDAARASARRALAAFDSSTWLCAAGATIVTGPTGQNLRDLRVLLADSPS